jgi:hypothetical protein
MSLSEVLERGQRVRLLSGEKGITIGKNENFDFPLWEIKLENGGRISNYNNNNGGTAETDESSDSYISD